MTKPGLVQYVQYSCTHMATMGVKGLYTVFRRKETPTHIFFFISMNDV